MIPPGNTAACSNGESTTTKRREPSVSVGRFDAAVCRLVAEPPDGRCEPVEVEPITDVFGETAVEAAEHVVALVGDD